MTLDAMIKLVTFAAVFVTLYAAHSFGDHGVQTHGQACAKGEQTRNGQLACLWHVATLTATKLAFLYALVRVTGLPLNGWALQAGPLVDAASHYWADRSAYHENREEPVTLQRLANKLRKGGFYELGDRKAAPTGTGAYALDQSWHHAWLFVAALIIAAGA
ncbi:transcriptional regulator [Nonomuraea sp. NPDC048901]|uniref:transcriptional regulator n=1 Tax=Nonomuraea sp. NPDC048901 TaxID=3155627 RepID=UPI0033E401F1